MAWRAAQRSISLTEAGHDIGVPSVGDADCLSRYDFAGYFSRISIERWCVIAASCMSITGFYVFSSIVTPWCYCFCMI